MEKRDGTKIFPISVVVEVDFKFGDFIRQEGNIGEFLRFVFSENKYIIFIIVHDDELSQNELPGNLLSDRGVFRVFFQFKDFA